MPNTIRLTLILFLFFIIFISGNSYAAKDKKPYEIKYEITWTESEKVSVKVNFHISEDQIELVFPDSYGPFDGAELGIKNIFVKKQECTKPVQSITTFQKALLLDKCGSGNVEVSYEIEQVEKNINFASSDNHFLPVINTEYVRWINLMALVIPWVNPENIKVDMKIVGNNKFIVSNLERTQEGYVFEGTANDFLMSFLYIRDSLGLIVEEDSGVRVVRDKSISFDNKSSIGKRIIKVFNNLSEKLSPDGGFERQNIFITELISDYNWSSLEGTSLHNTYWVQVTKDIPEEQVAQHIVHEIIHHWLPNKMQPIHTELTWFTEGFTEYLAYYTSYKENLISKGDFIQEINKIVKMVKGSPYASLSDKELRQALSSPPIWLKNSDELQKLPYWKGFLLALKWDEEIRHLNSETSIFELVYNLTTEEVKEKHPTLNRGLIETEAEKLGVINASKDIEEFIYGGNLSAAITELRYLSCGLTSLKEVSAYNLGFDLLKTETNNNLIFGVDVNGPAFKAGLRDGDVKVFSQFNLSDENFPVTIALADGRTVNYLPTSKMLINKIKSKAIVPVQDDTCLINKEL